MKRAQITIFVIIAIMLVSLVVLVFLFRQSILFKLGFVPDNIKAIDNYVQSCVSDVGEDAIVRISENGGYFIVPKLSTETEIPYYFYENKNYVPSKERVENEISDYIDVMLFFCTKNFVDFPDFNITQGKISSDVKIEDNEVVIDVHYPLSIYREDSIYVLENFNDIKIFVRLGMVYDAADNMIGEQLAHEESICMSCLLDLAEENDLYVRLDDYDKETVIFTISDKNSKIKNKDLVFIFANKYSREK